MLRLLVFALLTLACCGRVATAQSLDCGKPPEVPFKSQETEKLKGELEGKAQLLSRLIGNADLKGAVTTERNTIYQSADQVLAAWQAAYISYVFCASVLSDKSLSPDKRIDAWRQFQQAMQPPKAELTQVDVAEIKRLLENLNTSAPKLNNILASLGLDAKYPLGYALFYSNGGKTLHYGVPNNNNDVFFDPANIKVLALTDTGLLFTGLSLEVSGRGKIAGNNMFMVTNLAPGSIAPLTIANGIAIEAELLGRSSEGVAWVIGLRRAERRRM